jgi:hypothetical protein
MYNSREARASSGGFHHKNWIMSLSFVIKYIKITIGLFLAGVLIWIYSTKDHINTMHEYPHISFQKYWLLDEKTIFMLGQCESIIQAISSVPVKPEYRKRMLAISLRKGGPRRL